MRKLIVASMLLLIIALCGFRTDTPIATPADIGQTVLTVGQYGLLAWLVMNAERRIGEQQKAWREERRWLVELLFKDMSKHEKTEH